LRKSSVTRPDRRSRNWIRALHLRRRPAPHVFGPRQTEVLDLRLPVLGHEDVRGLDVPMDDSLGRTCMGSVSELHTELRDLLRLERLPGEAAQRLALVLVDAANGADMRVIEGRGNSCLRLRNLAGLEWSGRFRGAGS
jgi:hypothetical protein